MKRNALFVLAVAAALATGLVLGAALEGEEPEGQAMDPEMAKAMEMMQKLATPGKQHEELARMDGEWEAVSKYWPAPGAEPMVSAGTAHNKMIMGGRYSIQKFESVFMGQDYSGFGITGFDNYTQEYQAVWMDTMSTAIMYGTGKDLKDGGGCEIVFQYKDPMDGEEKTMRDVSRWQEDGSQIFEMFGPGPDGAEYKMMEIVYKKK